jgi:hypothetical protein
LKDRLAPDAHLRKFDLIRMNAFRTKGIEDIGERMTEESECTISEMASGYKSGH